MIVEEIELKDSVSAAAGAAAHQVGILSAKMKSLSNAMSVASALGRTNLFEKQAAQYAKIGAVVDALGGKQIAAAAKAEKAAAIAAKAAAKTAADAQKAAAKTARVNAVSERAAVRDMNAAERRGRAYQRADEKVARAAQKRAEQVAEARRKEAQASADAHAKFFGGQLESLAQGSGVAGQALSLLGPAGIVAGVGIAAAAAATGLLVGALYEGAKAAIEVGEQRRAIVATMDALTGNGAAALEQVDSLAKQLPQTTTQLAAMQEQFAIAGITSLPQMEQGMRAVAAGIARVGDRGGATTAKIVGLIDAFHRNALSGKGMKDLSKQLEGTGINATDLAKKLGMTEKQLQSMAKAGQGIAKIGDAFQVALIEKGAEAVAAYGLRLDVQIAKAKDNFLQLFTGVAETPGFKAFEHSIADVLSMLSSDDAVGKTMKDGLTGAFDSIFNIAAKTVRALQMGFLHLTIAALTLKIATKNVAHELTTLFGLDERGVAFNAVMAHSVDVMKALGVAVLVSTAPFSVFGAVVVAAVTVAGAAIYGLVAAITDVVKSVKRMYDAGKNMVAGFVRGIKDSISDVGKAATAMAHEVVASTTKALGIHSPSRVMAIEGKWTALGFAGGIASNTNAVRTAATDMAGAAFEGSRSAPVSSSSSSSSKSLTINVHAGAVVIHGGGGDTMSLTREALTQLLEEIALQQGLAA